MLVGTNERLGAEVAKLKGGELSDRVISVASSAPRGGTSVEGRKVWMCSGGNGSSLTRVGASWGIL